MVPLLIVYEERLLIMHSVSNSLFDCGVPERGEKQAGAELGNRRRNVAKTLWSIVTDLLIHHIEESFGGFLLIKKTKITELLTYMDKIRI